MGYSKDRYIKNSFSRENTDDWQIDSSISSMAKSVLFNKSHSSIFKEKPFTSYLKFNNISTLVITGLVSNGCVQAACLDAKKHGLSVILIGDGHSTFHKDAEETIIRWNSKLQEEGIKVISTDEFCSHISHSQIILEFLLVTLPEIFFSDTFVDTNFMLKNSLRG